MKASVAGTRRSASAMTHGKAPEEPATTIPHYDKEAASIAFFSHVTGYVTVLGRIAKASNVDPCDLIRPSP
ncbi:hypothetical protein MPL1032_180199 [Mesorhizobium plurifarium]|uniref:Uncharacterized protein n=1 Tax=Mesorhizobium plurifarium TaxID=69974 RepID=A0A0K2VTX7_MESPL|nr:hypothetical protein MPL1032_180199 [Mesorhizobium plurifarium]